MTRITKLEKQITEARNAYYNSDKPIMSDKAFDALIDELKSLDPSNKAITSVGAPIPQTEWKKASHQIPMGSLNKVNKPDELIEWANDKAPSQDLFLTLKLDGLSIEVIYENGKLLQGITRGDGSIGEDITPNVIRMGGVKSSFGSFTGSLRGEIILTKSNHKQFFSDKANPRNAASGISKRLDGIGCDKLNIIFYQALGDIDFSTEQEQFEWLKSNELDIPLYWIFSLPKQVNEHWRKYQDKEREKLDYDIDGLVVRVNDLAKQIELGSKDLRPKGAIAYKFDNDAKETIVEDVIWQVGNSGRITPIAVVKPVMLAGAEVKRASIFNMSYIRELQLDIGATVLVSRRNDVIPFLEEVIKSTDTILEPPSNCPECGADTLFDGEYLLCSNVDNCNAQVVGRLLNWVNGLNLLEWGEQLMIRLVQSKLVKTVADLYKLTDEKLSSLDRMGKRSAQKCLDILWANNEVPLDVFLGSLSIPMVGQNTIKLIMSAGYDDLFTFQAASVNDFENVIGVGPNKAKSLVQGLIDNESLIKDLLENGVKIKEKVAGKLTGKSVCFTGAMVNKRPVLEKMAKDAGADVKSLVGKSCTYLVIADTNSQSSKAQAARKLGTQLISEEEFIEMLK